MIAYLLGWIAAARRAVARRRSPPSGDRRQLLGYGLVALGLLAIGGRLGWSFGGDGAFWPLVLIGLGAAVLWLRTRDAAHEPPAPARAPTRPTPTPTAPTDAGHRADVPSRHPPMPMPTPTPPATPATGDPPRRARRTSAR